MGVKLTIFKYIPIRYLNSLLILALAFDTMSKAPKLTDQLVPVVQMAADVNAVARHRRAPSANIRPEINVTECLTLLHITALGCVHDDAALRIFWTHMRLDFVLVLLGVIQPIEDIMAMIRLLETSALEDSLGPLNASDGSVQAENENHIVDRVSALLVQPPVVADGGKSYTDSEMAALKIEVLRLLGTFCFTPHGGEVMAKHDKVMGRIVKIMNDELDLLYDYDEGHEKW